MDRKDFLKTCGLACVGGLGISALLQSCTTSQYFAGNELTGSHLKILQTEFTLDKKGQPVNRSYVLVKSEKLNFPIYLYKLSETDYSALWMECTHQGAELSAHGDYLTCPSHGSEFDRLGNVTQGPAQNNLRKFKTSIENQFILIHLS
ncbi:MAG: Rieske 2Fe-2S domain-containing protein [Cytophagaceae bacterium]|jgi:Rieske Fe-S protein|nr:Rieske 2Fe-2S domain-containing protein [Cytophagaceae bacterium]